MFNLFGCKKKNIDSDVKEKSISVEVLNELNEADIWIIPDNEENRKTTVWGKATVSGIKLNEKEVFTITIQDSIESFIINVIDIDKMYYSSNDVKLLDGYKLTLKKGEDILSSTLIVTDCNGNTTEYALYGGKL